MNPTRGLLIAVLLATLPASGCSVLSAIIEIPSDSSAGSARSIAGSFDAISTSSGSGSSGGEKQTPNKTSYQRDLRQYAAVFVKSPGTREDFLRGVARIAEDHGITHWEAESATPRAIGEGLRDANLSEAEMDAFVDAVGRDKPAAQLALEGYRRPGG